MMAMRLFRSKKHRYQDDETFEQWSITISSGLVRELGWQHRDDLVASAENGELRLRRLTERDRARDHVPGGRWDPCTGRLRTTLEAPQQLPNRSEPETRTR
jgi:hypothetical protein